MENHQNVKKTISNYSYNLTDIIGQGYSSKVYKGTNNNTGQVVAIKVISFEQLTTPISKSLLKNEINVLRQINHSNLMRVYEIFESKNNTYLVCEFCNEGDLAEILEKQKISEQQALEILYQLVQGIKALHDKSNTFDIKPANILKSNGIYKLADFGFAVIENQFESIIKKFNVGTPMYMAPETVQFNLYSEKSDIWALGIVLFQMIYNQLPFIPKNEFDLTRKHRILMNKIVSDVETSTRTKELIKNMLKYDADQRPTINDIILYLQPKKLSIIQQDGLPSKLIRNDNNNINNTSLQDQTKIQDNQSLKQLIKSQPDEETIPQQYQIQMARSQKLSTFENVEKSTKLDKIDFVSQLKDIKCHQMDIIDNKQKNTLSKQEQTHRVLQIQQKIQYSSPLKQTENINKINKQQQQQSPISVNDQLSYRKLQHQKSIDLQDSQSKQSQNNQFQTQKEKEKNSTINIPQFGLNKAIKLPATEKILNQQKQIDESECILHSNQNSTNDTIKHNQFSNCQQIIVQEKNIIVDGQSNLQNMTNNKINQNKSPIRVSSQQTISTPPFKLSGISLQRNSQEKKPNYYFQTKGASPILHYSSQTKPVNQISIEKVTSDFSNIKLEEDSQLPVKIRPTYKFLQFLNQTLKQFDTINTEEKQICYFLLKKLLAIKALSIINDCPQNKIDIIQGYIDSFLIYYKKIETLFYVSLDKQFELFFNKDLSQFSVQFSEILLKYIQQVNKIFLKKEFIEIQDILIENLKQQNDSILFARRWENCKH